MSNRTTLLETDVFKIVDTGANFAIYQKKTDDEGQSFLHRVWQSVTYTYTGEGGELELLLMTLVGHLKNPLASSEEPNLNILDVISK